MPRQKIVGDNLFPYYYGPIFGARVRNFYFWKKKMKINNLISISKAHFKTHLLFDNPDMPRLFQLIRPNFWSPKFYFCGTSTVAEEPCEIKLNFFTLSFLLILFLIFLNKLSISSIDKNYILFLILILTTYHEN